MPEADWKEVDRMDTLRRKMSIPGLVHSAFLFIQCGDGYHGEWKFQEASEQYKKAGDFLRDMELAATIVAEEEESQATKRGTSLLLEKMECMQQVLQKQHVNLVDLVKQQQR